MMQSCRKVTRQISQERERPLRGWSRLALGFHLLICQACRRYARQLRWLRRTARQTHLGHTARQRIRDTLSASHGDGSGDAGP